jgi:hypothetical protein
MKEKTQIKKNTAIDYHIRCRDKAQYERIKKILRRRAFDAELTVPNYLEELLKK